MNDQEGPQMPTLMGRRIPLERMAHGNDQPESNDQSGRSIGQQRVDVANAQVEAGKRIKAAQAELAEATRIERIARCWRDLDSLLQGAWGTENVQALGGGVCGIERARDLLGEELLNDA